MQENTFDSMVADFYRAATGSLSWDQAMKGVQLAFGATGANMHTVDVRQGQILSMHSGGNHISEANFSYVKDFHTIDPVRSSAIAQGAFFQPGRWVHCTELFDDAFVETNRFYQEFSLAYDVRYNSSATICVEDSTMVTAFTLLLSQKRGVLSADEREYVRRLGEHLREALLAHERVRRLAAQALAGHGLLSSFPYPMCLIDQDRAISFENDAAANELQSEKRITRRGNRLVLSRSQSDQQLTEKLLELDRLGHGASAVVDLRLTPSDPPTWLHLSLLVPGAVMGVFGTQPQYLATLFDPNHVSALDPFALSNMFQLTPAEARVASHMAAGLTAEEISQNNFTSVSTVRSQISQVISKLGARRTTDVVRMLRQGEALWSTAGQSLSQ
jgi:DNA-binding CsgD family transcriptional regulator